MPPVAITDRTRSRKNCGLPPERSVTTWRTCMWSGWFSVATCAIFSASCGARGLSSIRVAVGDSGALKPDDDGRRATAKSQGRAASSWVR